LRQGRVCCFFCFVVVDRRARVSNPYVFRTPRRLIGTGRLRGGGRDGRGASLSLSLSRARGESSPASVLLFPVCFLG
jgi:hypothetical protein